MRPTARAVRHRRAAPGGHELRYAVSRTTAEAHHERVSGPRDDGLGDSDGQPALSPFDAAGQRNVGKEHVP
jgi:hypothetical protein